MNSGLFIYDKPEITSNGDETPIPFLNSGYPYGNIPSDRRFEELVYTVYRQKITYDKHWRDIFDDVQLMQGVGDLGRDCVLYKNKEINAAIQCKKYSRPVKKSEVLIEILKFLSYSCVDNSLIPDLKNFTYYFVGASGFSAEANSLIDEFSNCFQSEDQLQSHFSKLKRKYPKILGAVDFDNIKVQLFHKVKTLQIQRVSNLDLDVELSKGFNKEIIPLFFNIPSSSEHRMLAEKIDALSVALLARELVSISKAEIIHNFSVASIQLAEYRDFLADMSDTVIPRKEAVDILKLIESDTSSDDSNIILLTGDPGSGKTSILKQVYNGLLGKDIPVLAIKCDRHYARTLAELEQQLNFDFHIADLVRKLEFSCEKIVVILDQIDSLSQSTTTNRSYIDTYNKLLHELKPLDKVKVVISIRTFDLEFDYEFARLKQGQRVVANLLSEDQVKGVLSKVGVRWSDLSDSIKDLLRTPNHLDTFFRVYNSSIKVNTIGTLQDLYAELWRQCANDNSEFHPSEIEDAQYLISGKLLELQTLSISRGQINSTFDKSINYLLSKRILILQGGELMFFHQSYHDYVFARSFVNQGKPLIKYIKESDQSIFIRPSVKMILTFLRQQKPEEYLECINKILFSRGYLFHIQLLIVQQVAYEKKPTSLEVNFVKSKVLKTRKFRQLFLESMRGKAWLSLAISEGVIDRLIDIKSATEKGVFGSTLSLIKLVRVSKQFTHGHEKKRWENNINLWFSILKRELPEERDTVLVYLASLGEFDNKNEVILRLLMSLKIWDLPLGFELFEKHAYPIGEDEFVFTHLLEDAIDFNFLWSIEQITRLYEQPLADRNIENLNAHGRIKLLEKMFEIDYMAYFDFSLSHIHKIIEEEGTWEVNNTEVVLTDNFFDRFDDEEDHISDDGLMMYKLLISTVKQLATEKSAKFTNFLLNLRDEKYSSIFRIGLIGILEAPESYTNEAFDVLLILHNKGAFLGFLDFYIKEVISKLYKSLSDHQKESLNAIISELKYPNELEIYTDRDGKKKILNRIGLLKYGYISLIPEANLQKYSELRREYLELKRRFGITQNKKRRRVVLRGVAAPMSQGAYQHMTLDQWENSLMKYGKSYEDSWENFTTGYRGNGDMFEKEIEHRAEYFISLIVKIVDEGRVEYFYLIKALNGLAKAKYDIEVYCQLFKKIMKLPLENYDMLEFIRSVDYIIDNKAIDEEIFNFLSYVAVNNEDPVASGDEEHPENRMLNTNRGAAVYAIVKCFYEERVKNTLLTTFESVANDPSLSVRLCGMHRLAVLMNLDKKRTLHIFLKLVNETDNEELLKSALWTAQYLVKYNFSALIPYFDKMISQTKGLGGTATVLTLSWLNGSPGAEVLLNKLLRLSTKAQARAIEVAFINFISSDKDFRSKCLSLYKRYLSSENKEIIHKYNTAFLQIDELKFKQYIPILKAYASSNVVRSEPQYFCEYLIKCAKLFPEECLDLIKGFNRFKKPNPFEGPYHDGSDPIKVVLGAYNGLCERGTKNDRYLKMALQLFDRLLKDEFYRTSAYKVLDVI